MQSFFCNDNNASLRKDTINKLIEPSHMPGNYALFSQSTKRKESLQKTQKILGIDS